MPPPLSATFGGILLVAALVASPPVFAASPTPGGYGTVSLVVNLGPVPDRARFGFALEGGAQLFWHESPYSEDGNHLAPLGTISVHVAWTRPVTSAQLVVLGGSMYPLTVAGEGFVPLFGVQVGAGLGVATDGAAGLAVVGQVVAPFSEVRLDTVLWRNRLHAPRMSAGLSIESCCWQQINL